MLKIAFIDIGELGWSLYLSAHARWKKENNEMIDLTLTHPDRVCLYENLVHSVRLIPGDFYGKFSVSMTACSGLIGIHPSILNKYFNTLLAPTHHIYHFISFDCSINWSLAYGKRLIFKPYPFKVNRSDRKEIFVFPRYIPNKIRNIPKLFYVMLIESLCDTFQDCIIRTIGSFGGAYDINNVQKDNYINWIGKSRDLQDLIDRCQVAKVAIGSQSAPPKISLLQGVPTFMIGHEEKRHVVTDNWMGTKAGFYPVDRNSYSKIDSADCIAKITDFVRGCV